MLSRPAGFPQPVVTLNNIASRDKLLKGGLAAAGYMLLGTVRR